MPHLGRRFWVQTLAGSLSALLSILTLVWHDWLELLFGLDLDQGSGGAEWAIVVVSSLVAMTCLVRAGGEWRRARAGATS